MFIESPERGVLKHFDYCVGKDGWIASGRADKLEKVFSAELKGLLFNLDYLGQWGEPSSAERLMKMASSISQFKENARSKAKPPLEAISDWEEDLVWLKRTFYDGRFDFAWPWTPFTT